MPPSNNETAAAMNPRSDRIAPVRVIADHRRERRDQHQRTLPRACPTAFRSRPKVPSRAHHAMEHDLTLKEAALRLGHVDESTFDRVVDPTKMVKPYVATTGAERVRAADTV
jgi:hypothetical protein